MSDPQNPDPVADDLSREELMAALFAQLVMQQANLAMMLMGKVPHPQTNEVVRDLEGARMFIDQLEMIEEKTKGNLSKEEAHLLKQSLMSLQMAFVDAAQSPSASGPAENAPARSSPGAGAASDSLESGPEPAAADEGRKKFSKKY